MGRVIPPSNARTAADRCPGLLRPHLAVDGAVVRVRLPGGMITAAALAGLAAAADTFATGELQLTSRANLQLRGVPVDPTGEVPDALVESVRGAGLLPSDTAELIRNILCSPFTGRLGGFADLRPLVRRLDELLCASPVLTALSGRFLFGLDDGTGDIASAGCDVGIEARSAGEAVLIAGGQHGPVVALEAAAEWLVAMAQTFLALRGDGSAGCWHVAELAGGGGALLDAVLNDSRSGRNLAAGSPAPVDRPAEPRYGIHRQTDGRSLLSLVVPLGRLTSTQARAAADAARLGSGELVVTPGHGLLLPDLPMAVDSPELAQVVDLLAASGLPSSPDSGWIGVSACTGAPGCGRAAGPTTAVATEIAHDASRTGARAEPVHVVACERRCGAPALAHREVMIELTGAVSRHRPPRADDGRPTRRSGRRGPGPTATAALSTTATPSTPSTAATLPATASSENA